MSTLLRAPSCNISRLHDGASADPAGADGVFDEMQGSCQAPMVFYDGGTDSTRYVYIGDMRGEVNFSDIMFDYTSSAADTLALTTDDVILTDSNGVAITVNYGGAAILSFTQCSARFAVPDLKEMGEIVMARGNYSYRIWDPDASPVTL